MLSPTQATGPRSPPPGAPAPSTSAAPSSRTKTPAWPPGSRPPRSATPTRTTSLVSGCARSVASRSFRREVLRDLAPVHDVPPRLDVVRADILVLQVVRVLPHVQPQDRLALAPRHRLPH